MAKMSRSTVEKIVAENLPGYRVLPKPNQTIDNAGVRQRPEASSPEIEQLMRKFHLSDDLEADYTADVPNGGAVDDEIALVEKIDPADPLSRGNRPKAKVFSPTGTIKGSQG